MNDRGVVPHPDLDLQSQVAPHLRRPQLRRISRRGHGAGVENVLPQLRRRVITGGLQEGFGVGNILVFGLSVARLREEFLARAAIPRANREGRPDVPVPGTQPLLQLLLVRGQSQGLNNAQIVPRGFLHVAEDIPQIRHVRLPVQAVLALQLFLQL